MHAAMARQACSKQWFFRCALRKCVERSRRRLRFRLKKICAARSVWGSVMAAATKVATFNARGFSLKATKIYIHNLVLLVVLPGHMCVRIATTSAESPLGPLGSVQIAAAGARGDVSGISKSRLAATRGLHAHDLRSLDPTPLGPKPLGPSTSTQQPFSTRMPYSLSWDDSVRKTNARAAASKQEGCTRSVGRGKDVVGDVCHAWSVSKLPHREVVITMTADTSGILLLLCLSVERVWGMLGTREEYLMHTSAT